MRLYLLIRLLLKICALHHSTTPRIEEYRRHTARYQPATTGTEIGETAGGKMQGTQAAVR